MCVAGKTCLCLCFEVDQIFPRNKYFIFTFALSDLKRGEAMHILRLRRVGGTKGGRKGGLMNP